MYPSTCLTSYVDHLCEHATDKLLTKQRGSFLRDQGWKVPDNCCFSHSNLCDTKLSCLVASGPLACLHNLNSAYQEIPYNGQSLNCSFNLNWMQQPRPAVLLIWDCLLQSLTALWEIVFVLLQPWNLLTLHAYNRSLKWVLTQETPEENPPVLYCHILILVTDSLKRKCHS